MSSAIEQHQLDLEVKLTSKPEHKVAFIEEVEPLSESIKTVYKISIPQIVTLTTMMLTNLYNVVVIGNLGSASDVAGAGMANMLMNIIANSNLQGMATALSTLVSQAYGKQEY